MTDPASLAFGVIGIAFPLLKIAKEVFDFLHDIRNAPEEIELLKILMADITKDLEELKAHAGPGGMIEISEMFNKEISDALHECKNFLDKYGTGFKNRGMIRHAVGQVVGEGSLGRLKGISTRIGRIYPTMITPLDQRLNRARLAKLEVQNEQAEPRLSELSRLPAQVRETAAAPPLVQATGETAVVIPVSENIPQDEQSLERFDTILGMKLWDMLHIETVDTNSYFENICGTTLILGGCEIPLRYRKLELEALQIAISDNDTTVLHFRCAGDIVSIKHIIPGPFHLATFPYVQDITSHEVEFRDTNAIIIMCRDGHRLFKANYPRYRFPDPTTRRKFQRLVRGCELIDEFEASEIATVTWNPKTFILFFSPIWDKIRCVAAGEPLQVWRKLEPLKPGQRFPSETITMTFLAETQDGCYNHVEICLKPLVGQVQIVRAEGSRKKKAVVGQWSIPKEKNGDHMRITFQKKKEASRFLELLFQAPCLPRIEMQPFDGC